LSPLTLRLLKQWITQAGIKEGAIFVRIHGAAGVGAALTAQNVMTILRKVGKWIGLDKEEWEKISGHSARVGAAQDLLAFEHGFAVGHAGGEVARYQDANEIRGESSSRRGRYGADYSDLASRVMWIAISSLTMGT
jgi:integrase/recombinase XerD